MKAIVYRDNTRDILYVQVNFGTEAKPEIKYYFAPKDNPLKFASSGADLVKANNLKGESFEFIPTGEMKGPHLTETQLTELKITAETVLKKEVKEKDIRTFINDKAIGDNVYVDLVADTNLSVTINKAIEKLGYQIIKIATTPLSFLLNNETNGLVINISSDGTMILDNLKAKKEITTKDTEDAVTAIKETYKILGVTPEQYSFDAKPAIAAPAKGLRAATSAANSRGGYHYYLETYTQEINAKLKPHAYIVNPATHTLENSNGQKITVHDDGSTEGTLFSDLGGAGVAQNIANDHIAVIKMHLALLHLVPPIFPSEKMVNLFLIQKNLSDAQKAQVPALQAEIKRLIEIEFAKNDYNDIRAMIRYEDQPLGAPAPAPSAPPDSLKISGGDPKPPVPPADPKENTITKENFLSLVRNLEYGDLANRAEELQKIIDGNSVFFEHHEDLNPNGSYYGRAGFYLKAGVITKIRTLGLTNEEIAFSKPQSSHDTHVKYPDFILERAMIYAVKELGGKDRFVEEKNISQERDHYLRDRIREHLPRNSPRPGGK